MQLFQSFLNDRQAPLPWVIVPIMNVIFLRTLAAIFLLDTWVYASPNTQIRLGFGTSTNPTQTLLPIDASYSQIAPEWRQPFYTRESVTFAVALNAEMRKFNDEFIASNADFTLLRGEVSATSDITPLLTGGIRLGAQKTMARIAAFKIGDFYGEPNHFSEIYLGLFGGNKWGNWAWQIETFFIGRDFELTSYEDKENLIFDDHKDFRKILKLVYDPPGDLKVEFAGSWTDRRYIDKSLNPESQNSPIPKGFPHPLEYVQEDYSLTVIPELDDFAAETVIMAGWDVDRTNGSTNQRRERVMQKFEFPFWKRRLRLVPILDILFRQFPDLLMPIVPVPRSDVLVTASLGLVIPFGRQLDAAFGGGGPGMSQFEAGFRYYKLGSSSNSLPHNYMEDVFTTDLTATF